MGALGIAGRLVILPYALAALAAVWWAMFRGRRDGDPKARVVLVLAIGVLAWIAMVAGGAAFGYPAISRFMLVPAAVISMLGGVGFAQLVLRIPHGLGRVAAAALLGGVTVAFALPRLEALGEHARANEGNRRERQSLIAVLERSRAKELLGRCRHTVRVVNATAAEIAWRLGTPLRAVKDAPRQDTGRTPRGILIVQGSRPAAESQGRPVRLLATSGRWAVYESGCRRVERTMPRG